MLFFNENSSSNKVDTSVFVNGLNLEALEKKFFQILSKVYSTLIPQIGATTEKNRNEEKYTAELEAEGVKPANLTTKDTFLDISNVFVIQFIMMPKTYDENINITESKDIIFIESNEKAGYHWPIRFDVNVKKGNYEQRK